MSKGFDLCRLAGLVKLKPYPEMVLVGESMQYPRELSEIYAEKYKDCVVVLFCKKEAFVRGLGMKFISDIDDREFFVRQIRNMAAKLTRNRIDVSFDEKAWETYYRSQTIAGRKVKAPRKWMPKKFEKVTDIRFESAELERNGNRTIGDFS